MWSLKIMFCLVLIFMVLAMSFRIFNRLRFSYGRYISDADFEFGNNTFVIGNEMAEKLFGTAERAVEKNLRKR